jgi:hypothetical protein
MPKSKNDKRPGRKIADSKVVAIWKCTGCGHEAVVPPTFYADSGVPICDQTDDCAGGDMEYVETRLLK